MATKKTKKKQTKVKKTAANRKPVKKTAKRKLVSKKKAAPKRKLAKARKMPAVKRTVAKTKAVVKIKKTSTRKSAIKKNLAAKTALASAKRNQGKDQSSNFEPFSTEETRARSAGQSGALQGLTTAAGADSESVDELIEEGNAFEAGVVSGVEAADRADEKEVRTHEVPEDDVPGEYLDQD